MFELLPNEVLVTVLFQYLSVVQVWSLFRADPRLLINKLTIDFVRQLQRRRFRQLHCFMTHETPIIFAGVRIWNFLHQSMYLPNENDHEFPEYLIREDPKFMNHDNLLLREIPPKTVVLSTATQRIIQSRVSLQNVLFDAFNGRFMFGDNTAFRCNLQRRQICNLKTTEIYHNDCATLRKFIQVIGSVIENDCRLGYKIFWTFNNDPKVWPSNELPPWQFIFKDMHLRSGTLKSITPLKT